MTHALLLVALLGVKDAPRDPPAPPAGVLPAAPLPSGRWQLAGFPIASYGSDVGLTFGGALYVYRHLIEHPDEQESMTLSLSYATRGPRGLDVGLDFRRLFGTSLRTGWRFHLGDDPQMPYWGEGAQLGGLSVPVGSGTPPVPYRYHDRRIFGAATLRGTLVGPLGWHLRGRFLDVQVVRQSELLAASGPPGSRGGRVALGEVGLFLDTRDREVGTHSGVFIAASAFAAPPLGGLSDFAFHGYDASARLYVPLWFGATLAARAVYDRKLPGIPWWKPRGGAVPFFERMLYEGMAYDEGLGGAATLRGVARYRISGDEKALANVELRANVFTTHIADHLQEYGISVGLDAGWAKQPGYAPVKAAGAAAGVRVSWDQTLVVRVEMGRTRHGDNTLYVSLGDRY